MTNLLIIIYNLISFRYVIKTIVYEIGILTDASNATDNETET